MLLNTKGIVLRSIKYGEHSLVTTLFTAAYGVQTYMVQGVRSTKAGKNRAGFFQPGMLLDLVVYQQPNKNLQRIREYQAAYIYNTLQQDVVKNSVVLFSAELLLRLLPEHAPLPELFDFVFDYFIRLDATDSRSVANFPLFFIIRCSRDLGFELKGTYCAATPHLDLHEGGFSSEAPALMPYVTDEDAAALSRIVKTDSYDTLQHTNMNADMRARLIEWYVVFLQRHTQHMGAIRSLQVLQTVLH